MMTRKISLLLPGFALLTTLALPLGTARAMSPSQGHIFVATQEDAPSGDNADDKKKPKPTPGPQEDTFALHYASDKKKPKPVPGPQDGDDN